MVDARRGGFHDAIPLGATGKIDKKQLRTRYTVLPIPSAAKSPPEHGHDTVKRG